MPEDKERQQMLIDAFNHLQSAIELLDRSDAPGTIGAHVDLALHQLLAALAPAGAAGAHAVGCR